MQTGKAVLGHSPVAGSLLHWQWALLLLLVVVVLVPGTLYAAGTTELYVGSVTTLYVGTVTRVAVGNESVVEVSAVNDGNVILLGKAPGVSEVYIWTKGNRRRVYKLRVYAQPQSDQLSLIRAIMKPFPAVEIKQKLGQVILKGTVDGADYERFQELAGNLDNVVSLVRPQLNVNIQDSIVLDVNILEINRNYQRTLGVQWQDTAPGPAFGIASNIIPNDTFGVFSDSGSGQLGDILNAVGTGSSTLSGYFGITSQIGSQIQLLEEEGVARSLASPSLSTVSGQEATFLAGGDFPVPVQSQFGQTTVQFFQFGIQLTIKPVMDRHHNIRSTIQAEMSSIDNAVAVRGVPGRRRRRTESTITARPGDTIVISGLINTSDTANVDEVPGLGKIPILGALFRSKDFQQNRTELVVTVTPRIQHPNEPLSDELNDTKQHLQGVLTGSGHLDDTLMR